MFMYIHIHIHINIYITDTHTQRERERERERERDTHTHRWAMPTVQDNLRRDWYRNEERQRLRIKQLETSKRELNVLKKEMQQMRLVVTVFNFQVRNHCQKRPNIEAKETY
jgi:hypothetical protein